MGQTDGPVGGGITGTELHLDLDACEVEVLADIIKEELIGHFRVKNGLKNQFLEDFYFKVWSREYLLVSGCRTVLSEIIFWFNVCPFFFSFFFI